MDENSNEDDPENKSNPVDSSSQPTKEKSPNDKGNTNSPDYSSNSKKQNRKTKQWMDIIEGKDIWNVLNFLATTGMLIATFLLFLVALPQARSAREASEAARDAVKVAEDNYKLAKEAYESSTKENRERLELEKRLTEAQIKTIETQIALLKEQFIIQNRPFLVITGVKNIDFGNKLGTIGIEVTYVNYGKYPTRILRQKTYCLITDNPFKSGDVIDRLQVGLSASQWFEWFSSFYLVSEPVNLNIPFKTLNAQETLKIIVEQKKGLAFGFESIYEDQITGKKYILTVFGNVELTSYQEINGEPRGTTNGGILFVDNQPFNQPLP